MEWFEVISWILVLPLCVPLVFLAVECFASLGHRPASGLDSSTRPRAVVLIPAHNEEAGIIRTLASVQPQLGPDDRLIVVADNCTDATARIVREFGAEAIERNDKERRGKGYALAFGRDALLANPPDVVIVIDADCTLSAETLHRLTSEAVLQQRPVQAANRLSAPLDANPERKVSAFAFLVKNVVRPSGLRMLGAPNLLSGTGMAFPWNAFVKAPLGHGHITEDLGLAVDLAIQGHTAGFVSAAEVRGEFPVDDRIAGSQRRRWEHGHLKVLFSGIPQLLVTAIRRGRLDLLILALEIGVPPLSALMICTVMMLVVLLTVCFAFGGTFGPVLTLAAALLSATCGLTLAWWRYGRVTLPAATLIRVPGYAVKKIGLYFSFLYNPQREWVRTEREASQ